MRHPHRGAVLIGNLASNLALKTALPVDVDIDVMMAMAASVMPMPLR